MIFSKNNILICLLVSLLFFDCEREDHSVKIKEGDVILTSQVEMNEFGKHHYRRVNGSVYVGPFDKEGNIKISTTDIINLDGLSSLDSIDGELQICRNYKLVNVDECLENLAFAGQGIVFFENTNLRSINGFNNLTYVNTIAVINHDKFVEIKGFSNLTDLNGNLILSHMHFLNNMDGFGNLKIIRGRLDINYCDALTELNALLKLENIGEDIMFTKNEALQNVDGLINLSHVEKNIDMAYNTALKNFCGLRPLLTSGTLGGYCSLHSNGYNPPANEIIAGNCSQ